MTATQQVLPAVQLMQDKRAAIMALVPGASTVEPALLLRQAQAEVIKSPDLQQCDAVSLLHAVYDAARLGLAIGLECHLVKYGRRAQLIVDYRGYIAIAYRSGLITRVDATAVYAGDIFEPRAYPEPPYFVPQFRTGDPEKITHVMATVSLRDDPQPLYHVMTREDVERSRAVSAAGRAKDGPWVTWWDRMALKTVLRYLLSKRLPVTQVVAQALEIETRGEVGGARVQLAGESDAEFVEAAGHVVEPQEDTPTRGTKPSASTPGLDAVSDAAELQFDATLVEEGK